MGSPFPGIPLFEVRMYGFTKGSALGRKLPEKVSVLEVNGCDGRPLVEMLCVELDELTGLLLVLLLADPVVDSSDA